ncbi:acyl-CoA dehydrogenase [Burkholderia ubonensis]|uniref:acyl-CoA dehydrogenase n=1 Tax=Burkholderia ubonensis TaxID=101571 RepID=UPI002ABDA1A2|nr:acyl-CoA dehydrogenase [Burkholderia ubonensis]
MAFRAPGADQSFVLFELLDVTRHFASMGAEAALDETTLRQIVEAAGVFASEVVQPLNRDADREGCRFDGERVLTPPGFRHAYEEFRAQGWSSLCAEERYGGQALPRVTFSILIELLSGASHAFAMYAGINYCASECLLNEAGEELKARWLSRLLDGSVLATMAMTEPGAGSDLGQIRTRAVAQPDGSFSISGAKIFISGGDQDLTANIAHLVLARLPGAPEGTKGLSLFLVPKLTEEGQWNGVFCDGVEHKLGLRGSATCSLRFEASQGWMVGEPHRGLASMFHMMNAARLMCAAQAVGLGEASYQQSLAYALERRQGRATGSATVEHGPSRICDHPDVQRMLMVQKAYNEGARVLIHWSALEMDRSERHPDAAVRSEAAELVALFTPILKGFLCENVQECTSLALQIHGGHGFISETGIDQFVRDARILPIYEGTTGIQAIDLLVRKLLQTRRGLAHIQDLVETALGECRETAVNDERLQAIADKLSALSATVLETVDFVGQRTGQDAAYPYRVASDVLRMLGHTMLAVAWARTAAVASLKLPHSENVFYANKIETAKFYFTYLLPEVEQSVLRIHNDPGALSIDCFV